MSLASRRATSMLVVVVAVIPVTACVIMPPSLPAPPVIPTESSAAPAPSATEPETEAEGRYDITAQGQDGSVWSFDVTSIRVVPTDSDGKAASPGFQLVEVLIDAEIIEGEPDFYYAFHVYVVDDATGDEYGLSSGIPFYAENDLFESGQRSSFTDGVGIFHVPARVAVDHVRVTTDQGGAWDFSS
ncbi:MAG: hypothetical protein ACQEWM_06905 [Actinomycetota bacterium]